MTKNLTSCVFSIISELTCNSHANSVADELHFPYYCKYESMDLDEKNQIFALAKIELISYKNETSRLQ